MSKSFNRSSRWATVVAAAFLATAAMIVPVSPVVSDTRTASVPASVTVGAARRIIAARYVLPETAARLDAALATAEKKGEFRGLSGEALAQKINQVLRSVTNDGHLSVRYDPDGARRMSAAPRMRPVPGPGPALVPMTGPKPGPVPMQVPMPGPAGGPGPIEAADMARESLVMNGGVAKLEVLPGNVRYIDYRLFDWGNPAAEAALASAMQFLRGGDAIIIDLRRNGGGSVEAVAALTGYFVPAGTPLVRFEMRGQPGEASAAAAAPFTLADRPVYVLVGKGSFSAAEEFAAHVSAFGFGKLVGVNTGGGAYSNELEPLPGGFVLSVSVARPVQARTGKDWEGVGIAPAIPTTEEAALEAAQADALQTLLPKVPAAERPVLERFASFYSARREGRSAARPLESYAGQFGDVTITVAAGKLGVVRGGRPPMPLQSLGGDLFANAANPRQQWRFEVVGDAVQAVVIDNGNGGEGLRLPRA